jgi:hypothetical protein
MAGSASADTAAAVAAVAADAAVGLPAEPPPEARHSSSY